MELNPNYKDKIKSQNFSDQSPGLEIEPNQQWERINVLLLYIAILLLFNLLALLIGLIVIVVSTNDLVFRKLHKKIQKPIGFPALHRAILSDYGFINDFTLEGKENRSFPRLPKTW